MRRFRATIEPIFGRIVRTTHSPGVTFRDEALAKDGDDHFSFLISQSRNIDVAHRGRDLRLRRGDATLMHLSEIGSVGSYDNLEFIAVIVPGLELTARGAGIDGAVIQRVPRQSEALRLLSAYIRSLERSQLCASKDAAETIRRHIIDLVALAVSSQGALGESSLNAVAAVRLNAAVDHITKNFDNPGLTVATVAVSQGISPRYLQRLLEGSGTTFTARVNELRLQRAFALLTEARNDASRISDIALQAGFSDISHFNRLFRSRFGDTPRGVRAQGSQGAIGAEPSLKLIVNLTGLSS
jgi:AraC-like DNA-binding protein